MKIVFLDIDGVICLDGQNFDKRAIYFLNKLINETGSKVVISSTWRYLYSVEELSELFDENGFAGKIIDRTPIWNEYKHLVGTRTSNELLSYWTNERGEEINLWLNWNKDKHIESFIIIDDNVEDIFSMFPDTYIKTDSVEGFTRKELLDDSISILNEGR